MIDSGTGKLEKAIATALRSKRESLGQGRPLAAKLSGFTATHIHDVETNKYALTFRSVIGLARHLNMDPAKLITDNLHLLEADETSSKG